MGGHIRVITIQPGGTFQKMAIKEPPPKRKTNGGGFLLPLAKGQPSGKRAGEATNNTT